MHATASPLTIEFGGDASLGHVLAALEPHVGKALVLHYGERTVRPGYHVTEVKAGSFVTLDCGGNPDAWHETILQVEDLAPAGTHEFLAVEKFRSILRQVDRHLPLDPDARLTFEIGPPGAAMQVFDVNSMRVDKDSIVLALGARSAVCKPRHRSQQQAGQSACCTPSKTARSGCC